MCVFIGLCTGLLGLALFLNAFLLDVHCHMSVGTQITNIWASSLSAGRQKGDRM